MQTSLALAIIAISCYIRLVSTMAPSGNPTSTFLAGRVNLPGKMFNKGYYVVGSFQVCVRPRRTTLGPVRAPRGLTHSPSPLF